MSCKEKNIDRSGYILCPRCKEGKFTFQDMPKDRVFFDSCPVCHCMVSVGFNEYISFVKQMGEGIPVPETKKCEEKCCDCTLGMLNTDIRTSGNTFKAKHCPCSCHTPKGECEWYDCPNDMEVQNVQMCRTHGDFRCKPKEPEKCRHNCLIWKHMTTLQCMGCKEYLPEELKNLISSAK